MPSNREAYFVALKNNIPKSVIEFALKEVNSFSSFELTKHFDDEIIDYPLFNKAMERFLKGEMIEYIFNKAYFLTNQFVVDKNVLIPRQETEQLVLRSIEIIKEMFGESKITIVDLCTGSGCIGISIAKELPNNKYVLTDISNDALHIANKNVNLLCPDIDAVLLQGDMLEPLSNVKADVIVCNPPYIQNIDEIDEKTWKEEPHLALLANPSTRFYESVLKNYKSVCNESYLLAFEIGEDMQDELRKLVQKYCLDSTYFFENDIYGKSRFLFIRHLSV